MKYLRKSMFFPGMPRTTIVVSEDALKTDIYTAATEMRSLRGAEHVDIEIFDHDGDLVSASIEGERRSEKRLDETTRHKHTLHDWLISFFIKTKPGSTISTTRPGPLSKEDILAVLLEVAKHPAYKGHRMIIHDRNGEPVTLAVDRSV